MEEIPSGEDAQAIVAAEEALQDRIGKARHLAAAERKQRELDANARLWPNGHWAWEARRHRAYIENFRRRTRGDHAPSAPRPQGFARPRGAGRPRARRATAKSAGGSSSDPGGDGPGEPAEPEVVRLRLVGGGVYDGRVDGLDPLTFRGRRINPQASGTVFVSPPIVRRWPRHRVESMRPIELGPVERAAA